MQKCEELGEKWEWKAVEFDVYLDPCPRAATPHAPPQASGWIERTNWNCLRKTWVQVRLSQLSALHPGLQSFFMQVHSFIVADEQLFPS